jgi:ketosteroid isomerase-like protein
MSEETVRVVERIQAMLPGEDVVAGTLDRDALSELVEPDFEVAMVAPAYDAGRLMGRGLEGLAEVWQEWTSPFESYRIEVEEMIDAGERVVSVARQSGVTKTGGVEVSTTAAAVWTVRDGRLSKVEFHLDPAEALRAAGLDPQSLQA